MRSLTLLPLVALLSSAPVHAADTDGDGAPDAVDVFPCDARLAGLAFAPGEAQHGMLLFEDMWPSNGDLDFNDVTLAYNYVFLLDAQGRVASLELTLNVMALGGYLPYDVWLQLPLPAASVRSIRRTTATGVDEALALAADEPNAVVRLVANPHSLFAVQGEFINTRLSDPAVSAPAQKFTFELAEPVALPLGQAPFDLFLASSANRGQQIHLPQYGGTAQMDRRLFGTGDDGSLEGHWFVNAQGLPFALHVPRLVGWPQERVEVSALYPDIVRFAQSGGQEAADWYASRVELSNAWTSEAAGQGPNQPLPAFVGLASPVPDTACVRSCKVLLIGDMTSSQGMDTELASVLSAAGMTPTLLAAAATTYAGLPVASDYDAVAILSGQSYALDMPLPGQQSIVDASRAGQGVVLNEWAAFQVSTGHWRVLRELQLLARASGTTARLTFSLESPGHPIWDGVPASFSTVGPMGANIGNVLLNGGVRVASCPQCGGAGVVVKDSAGRIVQFASAPNYTGINTWLTEPNITRLMTNAVRWAGRCQ